MKVILGMGLLTNSGKEWTLHCQLASPAFYQEKFKVQQHLQISFTNVWEAFFKLKILELKHLKTIENQRMYKMTFFHLVS
jgi:hypothetical protein